MAERVPLITLMTDFGIEDTFVGVMKGVITGICPEARIVDVSHAIPRFDMVEAAFRLREAYPYFPQGTIHVIIVDPGVGSDRSIVAMEANGHFFLAPDNGALCLVEEERGHSALVSVTNKEKFLPNVSASFHGRDIFAPVAAHLAAGTDVSELGAPMDALHPLGIPEIEVAQDGAISGVVLWCDHFGNMITNIRGEFLQAERGGRNIRVHVGRKVIEGLSGTYADVPEGRLLAMIGSFGALELAVRLGSARDMLAVGPGAAERVMFVQG